MRHIFALFILLVAAPLALAGSIRGVVRDAATLQPVSGMDIAVDVLNPDSTHLPDSTDAAGGYEITQIADGNQIYVLEGRASGYTSLYVRIPNLGSLDLVYDVLLTPVSSIPPSGGDSTYVSGIVHGLTNGTHALAPVVSAVVRLASGGKETATTTDANGEYAIKIPRGSYSVSVSAPGYTTSNSTVFGIDQYGATVNAVLQSTATAVRKGNSARTPTAYALHHPYPDPFNPSTTVRYDLPIPGALDLSVYDILGRKVMTLVHGWSPVGSFTTKFEPTGLPSGIYLVRLEARGGDGVNGFVSVRRVTFLK